MYQSITPFDPVWLGTDSVRDRIWYEIERSNGLAQYRISQSGSKPFNSESGRPANPLRSRAISRVLRVAAAQTGAVEGLYDVPLGMSITIANDDPLWREALKTEQKKPNENSDPAAMVEAQIATYEYLQRTADLLLPDADERASRFIMTAAWIRELHGMLTEHQETYRVMTSAGPQMHLMEHGQYKRAPNHVERRDGSTHYYCPVLDTNAEMNLLVDQLNSAQFREAHPLVQASYAHWALTHIHPFADGNGRVARALATLYLMVWHQVPLLIFADRKFPYLQALEAADHGSPEAMVRYMQGRVLDTLAWLSELEEEYANPALEADVLTLTELVTSLNGTRLENRDDAAIRVRDRLISIIKKLIESELSDFPGEVTQHTYGFSGPVGSGFRAISREYASDVTAAPGLNGNSYSSELGLWSLEFSIPEPSNAHRRILVAVTVSRDVDHLTPIQVRTRTEGSDELELSLLLEDTSPTISEATEVRLNSFARRILRLGVSKLQYEIEELLRTHGRGSGR